MIKEKQNTQIAKSWEEAVEWCQNENSQLQQGSARNFVFIKWMC